MRTPRLSRSPLVCFAIAGLVLVAARPEIGSAREASAQFQEPTSEELKMTADPKAPGASAVYLYHEETVDQKEKTSSSYYRIKVLTEKGKEAATVRFPYEFGADKVADIQGRTIHADGTVIPLTAKPSDLVDVKTKGFQVNTTVFTLPSVEVGSILEYRVTFRYPDGVAAPTWMIQQPYFTHKARYLFKSYNSDSIIGYSLKIGSDAKVEVDKKGGYTLNLTDVPSLPDDDWMPPLNLFKWHLRFFYTGFSSGDAFWEAVGKSWSTFILEFTKPTGTLKKAAEEIVAPGDADAQKAEKIYAAVMKLENTDFTRQKSKVERKHDKLKDINKAEDVWKQHSGSSDEIALLYVALGRAAGLKVWPMEVVDRSRALFDRGYLSSHQLDDYIAVVELGGKEIYLDPGQKMCPYGEMHWKHTFASGFKLTEKGSVLAMTPGGNHRRSAVSREAYLTVDGTGSLKGTVRMAMTGQEALRWRQLTLENDEEEVKKQFNESMRASLPEGVQGDFDHFLALEDYSANLIGIVNVSGSLGTMTGKHFFLPGLFFESRSTHPFVAQDKRTIPIDVHFPKLEQDAVTYNLPPGFNVESTPQESNTSWADHALYKVHSSAANSSVTVQRTLGYNFTLLDPKEYSNLHDFYLKVAAADQQPLVLTRAPQAKGN
jgi:hypothetical protein